MSMRFVFFQRSLQKFNKLLCGIYLPHKESLILQWSVVFGKDVDNDIDNEQ